MAVSKEHMTAASSGKSLAGYLVDMMAVSMVLLTATHLVAYLAVRKVDSMEVTMAALMVF